MDAAGSRQAEAVQVLFVALYSDGGFVDGLSAKFFALRGPISYLQAVRTQGRFYYVVSIFISALRSRQLRCDYYHYPI